MGIKRRIFTSGKKFIKKHRGYLDSVGATGADRTDDVVDAVPGMQVFVGEAEVVAHPNQIIELKAFIEGPVVDNTTKIDVEIDGTLMKQLTMTGETTDDITINGLTLLNSNCARYDQVGAHGNRRAVVTTAGGNPPVVLDPGSHSMKLSVVGGSEGQSRTIGFTVPSSQVTITAAANLLVAGTADAGASNVKIDLAKLSFSGFQPGVHAAYDPTLAGQKHGFKLEVLKQSNQTGAYAAVKVNGLGGFFNTAATGIALHNNGVGKDFTAALDNVLHADTDVAAGEKANIKIRVTPLDSANTPMGSVFLSDAFPIDRS